MVRPDMHCQMRVLLSNESTLLRQDQTNHHTQNPSKTKKSRVMPLVQHHLHSGAPMVSDNGLFTLSIKEIVQPWHKSDIRSLDSLVERKKRGECLLS